MDKHFAGGDVVRPHLLTTAIGHGRIAAETIDHFLAGSLDDKRPKVDVHQFNLLEELHARRLDPAPTITRRRAARRTAKFAIHNYEDRGATQIIPHTRSVQGPFPLCRAQQARRAARRRRQGARRFRGAHRPAERRAGQEGRRALHELRPVLRMRQLRRSTARRRRSQRVPKKERAVGRYVYTDYTNASAATSAPTCARPATSRWASGSNHARAPAQMLISGRRVDSAALDARLAADGGRGTNPFPIRRRDRASIASRIRRSCGAIT